MFERSGERAEHGRGEEIAHVGVQADAAHALDERHGKQRVSTEGEEVVLPADAFEAEQLGPQLGERAFGLALRCFEGAQREGIGLRVGQRVTIELAIGGEGQCIERDEGRRHHVVGQVRGEMFAQDVDIGIGEQRDIGDELLILRILMSCSGDDYRFTHRRMRDELCFDLAELDTEAANLDLMIVAAEELDIAVGSIASQVAGAVHAGACCEGIVEEAFGSELGPVQIATRHARAADIKLAHRAERHWPALSIEQINARVGDRLADGFRQMLASMHLDPGRVSRGLGGSIEIAQPLDTRLREDAFHQRELERFAGKVDRADRFERRARIQQRSNRRWHRIDETDLVPISDEREDVIDQMDRRTSAQRCEALVDGQIEVERCCEKRV
ncbi:hypothetical protein AWB70_07585 [Caballeronia cordobensis]|uniref:Uncharacterized protein n=1 Tax=Caballeronia cordobensis TaxID=1353886 RepID=A0A158JW11_CABCO|nr:hypothetical protein AWB70_07585 [Caballeronia cordobensis]